MDGGAQQDGRRAGADLPGLLDDLRAEGDELDALVAGLGPEEWRRATPAPGWTIAHQIAHLAWTDEKSVLAATDEDAFRAEVDKALANPETFVDDGAEEGASREPAELLRRWRSGRDALASALAHAPEGARLSWFGPPMKVASMATARLMETWAHGQDVADALGATRLAGSRLRHIARLGVRTRDFAYSAHGLRPPTEDIRVDLRGPDDEVWQWGAEGTAQQVRGSALDFCLVVTQRRHPADTGLEITGDDAREWIGIAQAFAGPPGPGRARDRLGGSQAGRGHLT